MKFVRAVVLCVWLAVSGWVCPAEAASNNEKELSRDSGILPPFNKKIEFENPRAAALLSKIAADDAEVFGEALKAEPALAFEKDKSGRTIWHYVASKEAMKCAKQLIASQGTRLKQAINAVDESGRNPLWYAVSVNDATMARLLVENGADVGKQDRTHESPASLAINQGMAECARVFYELKKRDSRFDELSNEILCTQIRRGHEDMALLILEKGGISGRVGNPVSPLELAVREQLPRLVKALLERKADPTRSTVNGMSYLQLAVGTSNTEITRMLVSAGASVGASKAIPVSAISFATAFQQVEQVKALLACGLDPGGEPNENIRPIDYALEVGNREILSVLISAGARLDLKSPRALISVINAIRLDSVQLVEDASKRGFDLNATLPGGWGALGLARAVAAKSTAAFLEENGYRNETGLALVKSAELDVAPSPVAVVAPLDPRPAFEDSPGATVSVELIIDHEGNVVLPMIKKTEDARLSAAAIYAVRQWKFAPLRSKGAPAAVRVVLPLKFKSRSEQGYSISEMDEPPQVLERVMPKYPFEAKRAGAEARVVLEGVVILDGTISNIRAVSMTSEAFVAPAIAALSKWKFKPALKDGKPVRCLVQQMIVFSLN
ncbi:TonB family protein [Nibricoccus sp. IMCC34717]|uniref:TonB family protein n=1 Tax=Nibricoccus sp. IMCC34717 TaxID=3034021 RepID=UPI00384F549B